MRRLILIACVLLAGSGLLRPAHAGVRHWAFQTPFGTYNDKTLRTGFAVYQADCARCHGLSLVPYRNIKALGLSRRRLASIMARIKKKKALDAKGAPSAKKIHRAMPPDLSLIEEGHRDGPDYVYSLLTGYRPAPPGVILRPDYYFDIAYPGKQIAMPPALKPGSVTLADGKTPSIRVMAHDVAAFLAWTAHPDLDRRKAAGAGMFILLLILGIIGGRLVLARRRITDKQI